MKKILSIISIVFVSLLILSPLGCGYLVDESEAVRAATDMGFTEVRVTDRSVFLSTLKGCSKGDAVAFSVSGKNPQGIRVNILVCVGWPFKGATIRSM